MISRKTCVRLVALIAFAVSATAFSAKHASFDGGMFDAMLNSAIGFNRKSPNGKTPQMSLRMDPSEMMEVFQAFLDVASVMRKSGARRKAYLEKLKAQDGPIFLEVKVKKGNRKDLGRPTTTPIQNKEALMTFLKK